jgi:hypothetical protein
MLFKSVFAVMSILSVTAIMSGACVTSTSVDESEENVEEASSALCSVDCDCPIGTYCNLYRHQCRAVPNQPEVCSADCQCSSGLSCIDGACQVPGACVNDCDCPVTHVCYNNHCAADFGPFPACRCDNHCLGVYELCIDNQCQSYFGGGG